MGLRTLYRQRNDYATRREWWLAVWRYYLQRYPSAPLPGRSAIIRINRPGVPGVFHARLVSSDCDMLNEIFVAGEYDRLVAAAPRDVQTVLDLGANAGYSIRRWLLQWPGCHVVAVEPDAGNLAMCRRNAAAVAGAHVSLIQACAVGVARKVYLATDDRECLFHVTSEPRGTPIDGLTVPDILARNGVQGPIDILKCDIEGAEAEVFAHCTGWIRRVRLLTVEIHPPYTAEQLLAAIRAGGGLPEVLHVDESSGHGCVIFVRQLAVEAA